jgi:FkbM family methyltransferase
MNILAHTCFIGTTGYANHARSFFTALNKLHTVRVRNYTIGNSWKGMSKTAHNGELYLTDEMKDMLIFQTLNNPDGSRTDFPLYNNYENFNPDVNIVLMEMNHHYYYDDYIGYKIAFNVWESTRYPDDYFNQLLKFDEVWVPTGWQYMSLIEQGYPSEKLFIVPEGVDVETFKLAKTILPKDKFTFLLFGRWDYRKSTTEIIKTFGEAFKGRDDVELICSVENPYPSDGLKTTKERIDQHKVDYPNVKYLKFPSRENYINYLQQGDVFVSCSRSEGWNLPLIEAMACGTPSIYSNWGGQLEFAYNKGLPVNISYLRKANIGDKDVPGQYCEPDFNHLKEVMLQSVDQHETNKIKAVEDSVKIHEEFNWKRIAEHASTILERKNQPIVFVTTGNIDYMPLIEQLVVSLNEFSKYKIIVYGANCDVPFDSPNLIKRRIDPPVHSEHDKWYWKQYACLESLNEEYENLVWIDGDAVVNHNIDKIKDNFVSVHNYPISDIHRQEEFFGEFRENGILHRQLFNENLCNLLNVEKSSPFMHVCLFLYNKKCKWWFEEIIATYKSIELKDYTKYCMWNDEGIDNLLRWKYGFKNHLPVSNFDTTYNDDALNKFYTFWNEDGPKNFNQVYGYQYVPKDKSNIIYFHGNKNIDASKTMIEFIKMKRDDSFYNSEYFYTDIYKLENLGDIKEFEGGTIDIANRFGWERGVYHEIYNLRDYYKNREKSLNEGDVVVDLGGNIGIFNRWAYSQGASKVISFEPDRRYFKLLRLNSDPRSVIFNAAVSDSIGTVNLCESSHFGGSNIFGTPDNEVGYPVRTYTLDYLFESGLINKIDFLKIDIEGAEHKAIKGISDENLMKVRTISMEYHHSHMNFDEDLRENFIKRLNKLGFNSYLQFLGINNALQMIYFTR